MDMKRYICLALVLAFVLALCACQKAPAVEPMDETPDWQAQYDLGVRYLSEGNYEEAIIAFTAAIEIDSKNPNAYFGRAQAYIARDGADSSDALNDLRMAHELGLDSDELHERLLESYEARGEAEEAEAERSLLYERTGLERYAPDSEAAVRQNADSDSEATEQQSADSEAVARQNAAALIAETPVRALADSALALVDAYASYWHLYDTGDGWESLDMSDAWQIWDIVWNYEISVRYRQGFDWDVYGTHVYEGYLTDSEQNVQSFVNALYQCEVTLPPLPQQDSSKWQRWKYEDGLYWFGIGDRGAESIHLDAFQRTGDETAELSYHVDAGEDLLCNVSVQLRVNPYVDPDSEMPFYYAMDSTSIQYAGKQSVSYSNEELEQMTADFFQENYPGDGGYVVFDGESTDGGDTLDVVVRFQWSESSGVRSPNVYVADIRIDKQTGELMDLTTYETIGTLW